METTDTPRTQRLLDELAKFGYSAANDMATDLCWELEREIAKLKLERDEAYERAAQVCDGRASWSSLHGFQKEYYEAEECAHEIRALKPDPTTEGK